MSGDHDSGAGDAPRPRVSLFGRASKPVLNDPAPPPTQPPRKPRRLGLSSLSAWFITLGIEVQFTRRGDPEDNGSHEQWHRVLKAETTRPPAGTPALQAARTTRWLRRYNQERPHEALNQQPPARHYYNSRRPYLGTRPPDYPQPRLLRRVHNGGEIKWQGRFRFVGEAFAGSLVALRKQRRGLWAVYFYHVLLGHLHDADTSGLRTVKRLRPVKGPCKV